METFLAQHLPATCAQRPRRATVPAAGGQAQKTAGRSARGAAKRTCRPAPDRNRTLGVQQTRPAPAHQRRLRMAVVVLATVALTGAAVTKRSILAASVAVLGHLQWIWVPAALMLELASLAALAGMQRRLLVAGGARVGVRPMLATTLAANAVSVSVPLAGPELGTLFTFRRLTRQGADATLASWSLLAGGIVSTAAAALVVAGGGLSSGNTAVLAAAAPVTLLAMTAFAVVAMAARRPRLRGALERSAAWALRHAGRVLRRGTDDPAQAARAWAGRLGSLHLPPSGWALVTALALANWLTDAAVLAVSIHAAGATVPWHILLLIYGSGVAAQSLAITPGGFGIAEGTLGLTLVAAGLRPGPALAAVLLYRLVSFWLAAGAGWLVFLWLRRHRLPEDAPRNLPSAGVGLATSPRRARRCQSTTEFLPAAGHCVARQGLSWRSMSAETPPVRELHLIVGFDGSPAATRTLDTSARLLAVRPPGRITVVWVAHLTSTVRLSADAIEIVEHDFDQIAQELRAAAAEQLGDSQVPWDFQWRQGQVAHELIAVAELVKAAEPDDVVVIEVGSSSSAMHRMVGSVAVNLARHSPVPVTIVP
jgi:putative heme transporter